MFQTESQDITHNRPELSDEGKGVDGAAGVGGDCSSVFARRNFRLQRASVISTLGQSQGRADRVCLSTDAECECGERSQEDLLRDRHVVGARTK